jgi:hypothetical protein
MMLREAKKLVKKSKNSVAKKVVPNDVTMMHCSISLSFFLFLFQFFFFFCVNYIIHETKRD